MTRAAVLVVLLALAACAPPPPVTTDTACLWVRPIYISGQDALTDETATQILAHNEKWKGNCK
jgi:hypothetical protein